MTQRIYGTIATAAGLVRAFQLRDSLVALEGDVDFRILVAEHPRVVGKLRADYPREAWVGVDEIGCAEWLHLAFFYEPWELACALQPAFIRTLLSHGDAIYIDPDSELLAPLALAAGRAHVLAAARPARQGPLDLGFLALPALPPFVDFMSAFATYTAEPEHHIAGPFAGASLPAALALWAAQLLLRDDVDVMRGGALRRYAGLAQVWGAHLGRYQDLEDAGSELQVEEYNRRLASSPYRDLRDWPYSFASYADGTPIAPEQRRMFLRLARPNRRQLTDPFADPNVMGRLWVRSPALAAEQAERRLRDRYARLQEAVESTGNTLLKRVVTALPARAYAELGRIARRIRG